MLTSSFIRTTPHVISQSASNPVVSISKKASMFTSSAAKLEIAVFGAALIVSGDFTHFTWWAVLSLVVSDATMLLGFGDHRSHTLSATISCCVSITVLLLSYLECSLFSEAYTELGHNAYTVANFAVHYWPSLRLLPRAIDSPLHRHGKWYYADAACLLTLYTALLRPVEVYGCANSHTVTHALMVGLSVGGPLLVQFIIAYMK